MAHEGFIGSANVTTTGPGNAGTVGVFLTGSTLNPTQEINAQDLVQGQYVKHLWNYGKVEVKGNIQAPVDEFSADNIFTAAWDRDLANDNPDHMADQAIVVNISYYRAASNNARIFSNLAIASYELSVTAGDVATFTAEFMGASIQGTPALQIGTLNAPATCGKLVTWDRCSFALPNTIPLGIQSFTFSVNNNLQQLFKVNNSTSLTVPEASLYPVELVAGFRDLTGTVTVFAGDGVAQGAPEQEFGPAGWTSGGSPATTLFGAENYSAYTLGSDSNSQEVPVTLNVGLPTPIITATFSATFKRPEAASRTDVQVYSLSWVGLCYDSL